MQSLGDALLIAGADGAIAAVNPRAASLVPELTPGTRLGTGDGDVPPPAPLDEALAGEVTVRRGGRTLAVTAARLEATTRASSGRCATSPSARAWSGSRREFVATASHELRSPLTSIKGFVELLGASKGLDARQREFLDIVLMSTNRLVDLVNDLLDVARIEAGRVEIHRRPADLGEIVDARSRRCCAPRLEAPRPDAGGRRPRRPAAALADPGRVRQILTNLLTNAHLYTHERRHDHGVGARGRATRLVLEVADTGRGMTAEQLEHVFDRFYRGAAARAAPRHGPRPGDRPVARRPARRDDRASPASPARARRSRVPLPRAAEAPSRAAARAALAGKRVLVVDDEQDIAELIAEHAAPYGVEPDDRHDGREALEALRGERFDALTLDILMPGMSGFEVLRALRATRRCARCRSSSCRCSPGARRSAGEWVVAKPIDADELADALGAAVLAGRVRVLARRAPGGARGRSRRRSTSSASSTSGPRTPPRPRALCGQPLFEVALVDAGLPDADAVLAALRLRGRRLRRSVVVFSVGGRRARARAAGRRARADRGRRLHRVLALLRDAPVAG